MKQLLAKKSASSTISFLNFLKCPGMSAHIPPNMPIMSLKRSLKIFKIKGMISNSTKTTKPSLRA